MIKAVFYFDDNNVTIHSENTKNVETNFLPGYYEVIQGEQLIIKQIAFSEIHVPFPNQNLAKAMIAIKQFLSANSKETCNEMGYIYKLNILLEGKQGVGKTALLNYLADSLIRKHNAIVFRVDNPSQMGVCWSLAEKIREIQDTLIVFIIDEFDLYCGKNNESFVKNCLDGNRSIDNSIVFAATNYIDVVPKTLKERPSRFRVVEKIHGISDKKIIKDVIKNIHSKASKPFFSDEEIDEIVEGLKETTIDQIKTILQDKVMNLSLGEPETSSVGFNKVDNEKLDDTLKQHVDLLEFFKERADYPAEGVFSKGFNMKGRQGNLPHAKNVNVESNIENNVD